MAHEQDSKAIGYENERTPLLASDAKEDTPTKKRNNALNIFSTASLLFSGIISAYIIYMLGPTLLDLQFITGTSVLQVSWYKSVISIGTILGTSVAGLTLIRGHPWLQMAVNCILAGITSTLIPLMENYYVALVIILLSGIFSGFIMNGSYSLIFRVWSGSDYQGVLGLLIGTALNVGFSVAPAIAAPFLMANLTDTSIQNATMEAGTEGEGSRIWIVYAIGGISCGAIAVCFFILHIITFREARLSTSISSNTTEKDNTTTVSQTFPLWANIMLHVCVLTIYIGNGCFSLVPGTFIVPFVSSYYAWPAATGADLLTAFGVASTLGTLVFMPLVKYLRIDVVIIASLILYSIINLLVILLLDVWPTFMWIYGIALGLIGMQVYFMLMIWIEQYFGFTGFITAMPMAGESIASICFSPLIGLMLEMGLHKETLIFSLGTVILCLVMFALLYIPKRYSTLNSGKCTDKD